MLGSNARVALKTLRAMSPEALARFKHEFRSIQDLHHPNLVTLGELVTEEDSCFFTMELVEGVDFLVHVRGGRPTRPERWRSGVGRRISYLRGELASSQAHLGRARGVLLNQCTGVAWEVNTVQAMLAPGFSL